MKNRNKQHIDKWWFIPLFCVMAAVIMTAVMPSVTIWAEEETAEKMETVVAEDAENAIKASRHCEDINAWVRSVVDGLKPSVKEYTNHQIDLLLALVLYEQSTRNPEYNDIFSRFTEVYQDEGGVY